MYKSCCYIRVFSFNWTTLCNRLVSQSSSLGCWLTVVQKTTIDISPGLKTNRTGLPAAQWSKVMFSDERKFSISGSGVWSRRREAQSPRCLRSGVEFPVTEGLGHALCWCWFIVLSEQPGSFRALQASCCWPTLWRCRFHFSTGLGTLELGTVPKLPVPSCIVILCTIYNKHERNYWNIPTCSWYSHFMSRVVCMWLSYMCNKYL